MDNSLQQQLWALLLAFGLGAALGFLYDLFRPPRYRTGRILGIVLDFLFCLAGGAAAFCYAMGAGNGRLGLWELTAMFLGFLLYAQRLSPVVLPGLIFFWNCGTRALKKCGSIGKKLQTFAKNDFPNVRE